MKQVFTLVFLLTTIAAVAHGQYGIIKTHGFFKESMPGTIAVDDNGNQIRPSTDTVFLAFLETKATSTPVWQRAWVNQDSYNVLTTKMPRSHRVGFLNDKDDAVVVKATGTNKLVQLNLERKETKSVPPASYRSKLKNNTILLEGIYNKRKVYVLITKPVHLRADEHP
jgi:hypothetical protein